MLKQDKWLEGVLFSILIQGPRKLILLHHNDDKVFANWCLAKKIKKYEVEFYYNNREYSYEIDANTGNVLSYEQD